MKNGLRQGSVFLAMMFCVFVSAQAGSPQTDPSVDSMRLGQAGGQSVSRSEDERFIAMTARRALIRSLVDRDGEGLLAAAKLMAKLDDPISISRADIAAQAATKGLTLQPTLAKSATASANCARILDAGDVLKIALQVASKAGNAQLVQQILSEKGAPAASGASERQACTWGNCCGVDGCWATCRCW